MNLARAFALAEKYTARQIARMIEIALGSGLSAYDEALRVLVYAYQHCLTLTHDPVAPSPPSAPNPDP